MTTYIGVDVGKKSMHIYLPVLDKSFEVNNDQDGFTKLLNYMTKHYKCLTNVIVVFEPTGGYERNLREFLKLSKVNFTAVHPNKVRSYAKAKGWLAKTDHIDSKLLSDYATIFTLSVKHSYNFESQENLQALIQRREQLILLRNQESNRLETEYNQFSIISIKMHLEHLDQQLVSVQTAIKELCTNDNDIQSKISKLTSIPGVGITVATTAICAVPELGNIEVSPLIALAGLAPYARESGRYKGRRSIFAGKGNLRKVLYMAAVASLRSNKKLKNFYDRLIANHNPPKVALVAIMRKLLCYMNALLKNNSFWEKSDVKL